MERIILCAFFVLSIGQGCSLMLHLEARQLHFVIF